MFLLDPSNAVIQAHRTLKSGSRFCAVIWDVEDRCPGFNLPVNLLEQYMDFPKPPPGAPGIFRLAEDVRLENLFLQAGLTHIELIDVQLEFVFDSGDHFVQNIVDMAAPMKKCCQNFRKMSLINSEKT